MDATLKNKFLEIIFDKFVVGIVLIIIGFLLNGLLERNKLIEAQRVADTTDIVKSCSEIWTKVYEYESYLYEVEQLKSKREIAIFFKQNDVQRLDESIQGSELTKERKILDIGKLIDEKRFLIGDGMAMHFGQYIGFVTMRANAKNYRWGATEAEKEKNLQKLTTELDQRIAAMRFTVAAARQHAITRLGT